MSVIPKIPRASGGFAPPPWAPYQGYTLDQLGTLSGPQTPRILTPPNHKSWIRVSGMPISVFSTFIVLIDIVFFLEFHQNLY